jgi:hypothetical protein
VCDRLMLEVTLRSLKLCPSFLAFFFLVTEQSCSSDKAGANMKAGRLLLREQWWAGGVDGEGVSSGGLRAIPCRRIGCGEARQQPWFPSPPPPPRTSRKDATKPKRKTRQADDFLFSARCPMNSSEY